MGRGTVKDFFFISPSRFYAATSIPPSILASKILSGFPSVVPYIIIRLKILSLENYSRGNVKAM